MKKKIKSLLNAKVVLSLLMVTFIAILSCNSKNDKKTDTAVSSDTSKTTKTLDPNSTDTRSKNFFIKDTTMIKGFNVEIIQYTTGNKMTIQHLSPLAYGVKSITNFPTHDYRLSEENIRTLLTSNIQPEEVKQIVFDFKVTEQGEIQMFAIGKSGDGDPLTDHVYPEIVGNRTLKYVSVFQTRLTRGEIRTLLKGTTSTGPIEEPYYDLGLEAIKSVTGSAAFKLTNNAEAGRGSAYSNPIPPAKPGCEPHCDE